MCVWGCVPLFLSENNKNQPPPLSGHGKDADKREQSYFLQRDHNLPSFVHHVAQDAENPSNGSVADKADGYDIGVLATSTLMGETGTQT